MSDNESDSRAVDEIPPGKRNTNDPELLLIEAQHAASDEYHVGNVATPADEYTAKQAIRLIEGNDLTPAWRLDENER